MKNLVCLIILFTGISYIKAQVNFTKRKDTESIFKREVSIQAGPAFGTILSENIKADKYAEIRRTFTPNLGVSYFIPAGKHVGYVVGFEYNRFIGTTAYKGYFRSATLQTDIRGGRYYPLVEADYTSQLHLNCLDIPLSIRFRGEMAERIEFFAEAGLKLNVILSYKKYLDGVYNKKGLYPGFTGPTNVYVLLENEPSLGFTNTTYTDSKTDLEGQKVAFSARFASGIKILTSARSFVTMEFSYLSGLTDINGNNQPAYLNVFEEKSAYKKYTVSQFALRLGVGLRLL